MAMTPLISVVIPSYMHGHLVGRALQSVLDQSYGNWETIVVDNCSTDDTDQVVNGFADSRIKLLKINNNGVIAASRNLGIREAKGSWVAFLDSDDWWNPGKLSICMEQTKSDVDVIYHKLKCYSLKNTNVLKICGEIDSYVLDAKPYETLLRCGPALTTSAVIVRRSCLLSEKCFNKDVNIAGGEDIDMWLRLAKAGYKFRMINGYFGYFLIGGVHVTSADKSLRTIDFLQKHYCDSKFSNVPTWMHKSRVASYLKLKNYPAAYNYILRMLRELPFYQTLLVIGRLIRAAIYGYIYNIKAIN